MGLPVLGMVVSLHPTRHPTSPAPRPVPGSRVDENPVGLGESPAYLGDVGLVLREPIGMPEWEVTQSRSSATRARGSDVGGAQVR